MDDCGEISSTLNIRSRAKYTISAECPSTRVKSVNETLAEIGPVSSEIGVTRISDITMMDRLYIPNYSVVLPGTQDSIWVYNGKGPTRDDAKLSALMEAIERHSSLHGTYKRKFVQGSYSELSKSYAKVLHPAEVVEPVSPDYDEKRSMVDYLCGFDLLNREEVLVPAEIALYKYSPRYPTVSVFPFCHTNGLASGNVLEEAICHALCEVIERDAVSIADLCASSIQYNVLEKMVHSITKGKTRLQLAINFEDKFADDTTIYPDVDLTGIPSQFIPSKKLLERFSLSEIPLLIKDITPKDIGIPTFIASSIEWLTEDYGFFAKGYGTHPDSRVALTRAITEVSQTRAANIQGARDDLKRIRYKQNDDLYKRKWQFVPTSLSMTQSYSYKNNIVDFNNIRSFVNNDILDDINLILSNISMAGLKRAIIVDLTNPNIGIPVVRAIVPGLESFEVTKSIMGNRAIKAFKNFYRS